MILSIDRIFEENYWVSIDEVDIYSLAVDHGILFLRILIEYILLLPNIFIIAISKLFDRLFQREYIVVMDINGITKFWLE